MSSVLDTEYITVAEAATALKISQSTVWRWINEGRLPAYRVGQRRVRVNATDVAALITPARSSAAPAGATAEEERIRLSRPLTAREKERALAAIEATRRLRQEMAVRRGGIPFSPSHLVLNELRDQRTRELGQ